jgi:hypothetical protein
MVSVKYILTETFTSIACSLLLWFFLKNGLEKAKNIIVEIAISVFGVFVFTVAMALLFGTMMTILVAGAWFVQATGLGAWIGLAQ